MAGSARSPQFARPALLALPLPGPDFTVGEGGSFTWKMNETWEDCSYSGQASWTGNGAQEGGPSFLAQFVDGAAHRGYGATSPGHLVSYQVTCPDGAGGTVTSTGQKSVVWINTIPVGESLWVPQVSADGLSAAGTADDGNMACTWSFNHVAADAQ